MLIFVTINYFINTNCMSESSNWGERHPNPETEAGTENAGTGIMSKLNELANSVKGKVLLGLEAIGLMAAAYGCAPKPVEIRDFGQQKDATISVLHTDNKGATADISICARLTEDNLRELAGKLDEGTMQTLLSRLKTEESFVVCMPNARSMGPESTAKASPEGAADKYKKLTPEKAAEILDILDNK